MATAKPVNAVFLDLGGTLVDPKFSPQGKFLGFTEMAGIHKPLTALAAKCRLGVISNTGDIPPAAVRKALTELGLLELFDAKLVLLSGEVNLDKSTTKIFLLAAEKAGAAANLASCVYVGDDGNERRTARQAGLTTRRSLDDAAKLAAGKSTLLDGPNLSNLAACVIDARDAGLDSATGPADPLDFADLLQRLEAATPKLPPLYRERFALPFKAELLRIGPQGFTQILVKDPRRERLAGLMLDTAHAILQNGEGFESVATDAFEEVVSDLYDGFLGAEGLTGLKVPDDTVLAPLVKWGNPDSGPYTWPIDATRAFKCAAAVVSLPPANARGGLFAWTTLGHETAGHDILRAIPGLQAEMAQRVRAALLADSSTASLATYWSQRIDETSSDVMGILNMGPSAGIGLVVYFRGLNAAFSNTATLRNEDSGSDPHPLDILRGFLAAATVRQLSFQGATAWAQAIEAETMKDVTQIRIAGVPISLDRARRSCDIVAKIIAATPMDALDGHALIEMQNWRDEDEAICRELQTSLLTTTPIRPDRASGVFAAHVVAAASTAALAGAGTVGNLFRRTIAVLKTMHDANAAWGPLFIAHPGTISRDLAYVRCLAVELET